MKNRKLVRRIGGLVIICSLLGGLFCAEEAFAGGGKSNANLETLLALRTLNSGS
ncbi:MAG: hypothetical protein K8F91_24370 [Candidatus Obscuribacterales bacterium]|nr:hypothetical protein [Candidatus Obscuribacterales bacterium]